MHRPRPPADLGRPGHPALDREVELECARAVPVAAKGAGHARRQPVPGDRGDVPRRQVEDHGVGLAQLLQRADPHSGLDPPPVRGQRRGQRRGDRAGAALGDRPAVGVAGADERHPDRRGQRAAQGRERVAGDAGEQRCRLLRAEAPRKCGRRNQRADPEQRQPHRVTGQVKDRPHEVVAVELREAGGRAAEGPPPSPARIAQARHGLLERAEHRPRPPAVERVGEVDLRVAATRGRARRDPAARGRESSPPGGGTPSSGR